MSPDSANNQYPDSGPKKPKRRGFRLVRLLSSAMACATSFLAAYVMLNSLAAEFRAQINSRMTLQELELFSMAIYFLIVVVIISFLAALWKGESFLEAMGGFWPPALIYAGLDPEQNILALIGYFCLAGVLGAMLGGKVASRKSNY